jgi:hypothetical protein
MALTAHQTKVIEALRARFGDTCTRKDLMQYEKDTGQYVRQHWIQDHKAGRGVYDLWLGTKGKSATVAPGKAAVEPKRPRKAKKQKSKTVVADAAYIKRVTKGVVVQPATPKTDAKLAKQRAKRNVVDRTPGKKGGPVQNVAAVADFDGSFTDSANAAGLSKLMGAKDPEPTVAYARHSVKTTATRSLKGSKLRATGRLRLKDDDCDDGFDHLGELRKEARHLAIELGHDLGKFKGRAYTNDIQQTYCQKCLQLAVVNAAPEYTDMEKVYGRAVTTECEGVVTTLRGDFGGAE